MNKNAPKWAALMAALRAARPLQPKPQPGYSLVFAFLIMTIIMIVASTTISNTTGKIRYFNELEGASQARLAAESAADLAILAIKDYQAGYEPSDSEAFCLDFDEDGECEASGSYEVTATGQSNENDGTGEFYIPIPGTGTAAPTSECTFDLENPESIDHPCNWNKILYGESVVVPLYIDTGSGLSFPEDWNLSSIVLRMRLPCSDGSDHDDYDTCTRHEFDDTMIDSSVSVEGDDAVVFWQVNTVDEFDNIQNVTPHQASTLRVSGSTVTHYRASSNTEVYESILNSSTNDVVLTISSTATDSRAYDAIIASDLRDAYLQLDIISQLIDSSLNGIPYIEWQLMVTSDIEPAGQTSIIQENGYSIFNDRTYFHEDIKELLIQEAQSVIYTLSN